MAFSDEQDQKNLELAIAGNPHALGELMQAKREKLLKIIRFRINPKLRSRLDEEDVLQEALVEATTRFPTYANNPEMPFFLWLRFIAVQKVMQLHRTHLGVQARDASREISIFAQPQPHASSAILAAHLMGKHTSPSIAAMRAELAYKVELALNSMSDVDREILALRRFEGLKNGEVAKLLNITKTAASNRYVRALERLNHVVEELKSSESRI